MSVSSVLADRAYMTTASPTPAELERADRLNRVAWMLVLLAFAAPYAATWMGLNPAGVGADFSRTFVSFVLLFLIAWVLVRARGIVARAKALVVVGVLLCLIVGTNAVRDAQVQRPAVAAPR
jgi:hypothetical protein